MRGPSVNSGGLGGLPAGTVTVLLADAGDSAQPLPFGPEYAAHLGAAVDCTQAELVAARGGLGPVERAGGKRLVFAFASASDAVGCALALQRAPLAPTRPRIAVHTGEVSPAEQGRCSGPVMSLAGWLCDLAHGGQTVLSTATARLVADRLPPDAWLVDLGSYRLPGRSRPQPVVQLCHRDLVNDFPPLRTEKALVERCLPAQLTSFVGRDAELAELRRLVAANRLVTLTGAGGVGKSRLALQLVGEVAGEFAGGVWWVDLAPVAAPDLVASRVAHTLGLADQPGRSATDNLIGYIGDAQMLVVLDNCEHLLDGCAPLVASLLGACAGLRIVATSREATGVAGEVTWLTPQLSLVGDAVGLFTERARLVRPDFTGAGDDAALVGEICRCLDGVPLAIELAATRLRALSLTEILDGLSERLQLLNGGRRAVVSRHQTLRASEDWSHALLSEPEQVVFRRLAVFRGGFDRDAVAAVAGDAELLRSQTVATLAQLVDKSLVVADSTGQMTRYRMLETVRQYAQEKLDEADESDTVRTRHRDHYTARFAPQRSAGYRWDFEEADTEFDNLDAAFTWSCRHGDIHLAARLASSLLPLWINSRIEAGLAWFNAILTDSVNLAPAARAHALADKTILEALTGIYDHLDQAEEAVAIARDLDDPALLGWALAASGFTCSYSRPEIALSYLQDAIDLAPALDDDWRLAQIYVVQAYSAFVVGELATVRDSADKGGDLAEAVGDPSVRRICRNCKASAQLLYGDLVNAALGARQMVVEAQGARDPWFSAYGLMLLGRALAHQGDTSGAREAAEASVEAVAGLNAFYRAWSLGGVVDVLLAAGDVSAALVASNAACQACALPQLLAINGNPVARAALAARDVVAARRWVDEALALASGVHRITLLEIRVRVAIAEGEVDQAERDARDALAVAAETQAYLSVPELIECLAMLAADAGRHREAARLFGSAASTRDRSAMVRFKIYDAEHTAAVEALRDAMGPTDFDSHWAEGAALSTADAVARALRGRGRRNRPSSGWAALTPAERNVVQLVGEGLRNKDIAAKLFISPRTVETHLSNIYAKLGVSSRVKLVQEAARHT